MFLDGDRKSRDTERDDTSEGIDGVESLGYLVKAVESEDFLSCSYIFLIVQEYLTSVLWRISK